MDSKLCQKRIFVLLYLFHFPYPPKTHIPYPVTHNILDALDSHRPLGIQRVRVAIMALLLAVLQAAALVVLQHAVLTAEVPLAEGAVAHDALRPILAVLEGALDLLRRHAAADGQRHVQGRGRGEEIGYGRCGVIGWGVGGG